MCQALANRLGTVQGAGLHRCADGSTVNPLVAELGDFNPMEGLVVVGGGEGWRQEQ